MTAVMGSTRRGETAGLVAALMLSITGAALARPPGIVPGDFVVTRTSTSVMDQTRQMATIPAGRRLIAIEVRGPWVLVGVKRQEADRDSNGVAQQHGTCPECGQPDWARSGWPGGAPEPRQPGWIRGWVYSGDLRRADDCGESSITFVNQSGEAATVRLVGPSRQEAFVPSGASRTLRRIAAGHYWLLIRYEGSKTGGRNVAGEHFNVEATQQIYSRITITLHGVVGGNYGSASIPAEIFDSWGVASPYQ